MAADLVRRRMAVIVAGGGSHSAMAAKKATTTVPIVFATGGDPVKLGMVPSLARPGGNITGVSFFHAELTARGRGAPRAWISI
jgi:putative tryptophan/tyrosine transport system substrate-binding protein